MHWTPENVKPYLIVMLLAVLVLAIYWQTGSHSFINYDDKEYVTNNARVQDGLTKEGLFWAFKAYHAGNWHPLTWLSHMADVELFGLSAAWHHRMNMLYHLLNTELLFLVLWRMTGGLWQSGFAAALFGVHPLHVESVAWVAERKDLLSALFWILTMGAYLRYVRRQGFRRYLLVVICIGLGLASKPMLVTLPFVLLLLDFWPLGRFGSGPFEKRKALILLYEKIPLLILTVLSCTVTVQAQASAESIFGMATIPLAARIENALLSYVVYLSQMLFPASLSVFYPHNIFLGIEIPTWKIVGSILAFFAISVLSLRGFRHRP